MLPIRASAYILSLLNEQVGKGAMSLYLAKRHEVPGWQALSTMVMLGLMEIYQLLFFSGIGVLLYYELVQEASTQVRLDLILPTVFGFAVCYLPLHILFPWRLWRLKFETHKFFAPSERLVQYTICCFCCLRHQICSGR